MYEEGKDPVFYEEGIEATVFGDEPFIADQRGFFLPPNTSHYDPNLQKQVAIGGFVAGAKVLSDQKTLVMAHGQNEEDTRLISLSMI